MAILNTVQLADHYGTHRQTVIAWVKRGMPYITKGGRGKEYEFDSAKVAEWKEKQAINNAIGDTLSIDADELKQRKLAAETTIAEIEAAKARGQVLELDAIVKVITDDYITLKQRLRQIGQRIAPLVVGEIDELAVKKLINEEIDDALTELSTQFTGESEDTESDDKQSSSVSKAAA